MAIVCPQHRLLFIQAPRTGCTAIAQLLKTRFGGEQLPAEDIVDANGHMVLASKHCSLRQLIDKDVVTPDSAASLITFTTVRNPFDSLVSLYVKKRDKYRPYLEDKHSWVYRIPGYVEDMEFCRTHSFEEWLDRHYRVGAVDRLLGRGRRSLYGRYTEGVQRIMRFERLQADFDDVMRSAGVSGDVTIATVNATPRRQSRYQAYYTDKAKKLVEYVFADELQKYGYSFDGIDDQAVPGSPEAGALLVGAPGADTTR